MTWLQSLMMVDKWIPSCLTLLLRHSARCPTDDCYTSSATMVSADKHINQWIESFLSRTRQVVVEGQVSSEGQVTSSVPQGSVLGPTLFLAYINYLSKNIKSQVRLFVE